MNTLFIYDTKGTIISQMSGDVAEPVGIPFLWVDIPEGKRIISINTSVIPNVPIYGEIPQSEVEKTKEDIANLNIKVTEINENAMMALEAAAAVYEAIMPFLP